MPGPGDGQDSSRRAGEGQLQDPQQGCGLASMEEQRAGSPSLGILPQEAALEGQVQGRDGPVVASVLGRTELVADARGPGTGEGSEPDIRMLGIG